MGIVEGKKFHNIPRKHVYPPPLRVNEASLIAFVFSSVRIRENLLYNELPVECSKILMRIREILLKILTRKGDVFENFDTNFAKVSR